MASGRYTVNDAQIAQILITIAEHAGRLVDPAYGKKLREDILMLPEEVQIQLNKAQEIISQAETVKTNITKQTDEANERLAQRENLIAKREKELEVIKAIKSEAESIATRNKETAELQKKEASRLADITATHEQTARKHIEAFKEIEKQKQILVDKGLELDKRKKAIEDYEREIEEIAAQMSGLVKTKLRK